MGKKEPKTEKKESKKAVTSYHVLSLVIIVLIVFLLSVYFWITTSEFIGFNKYAASTIPLVLKYIDPGLYSNDLEINYYFSHYPKAVIWVFAKLYIYFGDFKPVFGILFLVLSLIFLVGIYAITYKVTASSFCSVLMIFLSIPTRQTLGTDPLWGIALFSTNPFAKAFVYSFTPWFIYFFLEFSTKRDILTILFFILALSMTLDPISSIHLFILFCLTMIILEKRITKWFKMIYLPVFAFLTGSFPFLIQNCSFIDTEKLSLNFSFLDLYQSTTISNKFLFDIIPILIIALFICFQYSKDKVSHSEKLILIILVFSIIISMTYMISPYISWLKLFQFNEMSKFYFLISFIFAANYLGNKFTTRTGYHKFLPALVILILLFPGTYIHPLENYLETLGEVQAHVKNDDSESDVSFSTREVEDFLEMCEYCKKNTPINTLFLLPPRGMSSFRVYARRSMVINTEYKLLDIFSYSFVEKWILMKNKVESLYNKPEESNLREFIKNNRIDYIIFDKRVCARDWERKINLQVIFSNKLYFIVRSS
jgi:hypothetical protein